MSPNHSPVSTELKKTNSRQGIPEDIQQEQQQAAPRGGSRTPAATTQTPAAAPATGTTPATGDAPADTDAPINLFEAAAQANRGGAGTTGGSTQRSAGRAAVTEAARGLNAAAGGRAAGAGGNLDFLRHNPQFQQLRQIVQGQPQMLEPILQQVGAGNPQLAGLIGENPDQFLQLLAEDTEGDTPLPPGAQEISVTEDERAAIERVSDSLSDTSGIGASGSSGYANDGNSCVSSASNVTSSSRPTSRATRTKNSRRISSSINRMMEMNKSKSGNCNERE